ncbi:Stp1/IreP family PP2C-type Ser/Thr phosphatase [Pseudoflavonifractor phocaeensis]|uniref:Stp1/IreP family PP2C-type Ser/Thr phosphatase n=1 Tax=Pseudoflavonifractor phocaeensis TaxID=1870988 RepID=UPI001F3C1496|nr:Stp1/IreP family PP2C-type Ser/Thr phosphatase [Pseudoflavonifractor phocaeensis]MCF2596432.1 Stp1/IreP family PP2C-type Ser/Thr phosphatase [Pseudoflavonifractor phocaeensis]
MEIWGVTHRGAVRQQNQDSFASQRLEDGRIIALVCDGMGGARAGNVASTMAVDLFMRRFLEQDGESNDQERMQVSAAMANQEVFQRAATDPDCAGMGTTLVAALAGPGEAVILNEGDSRAYHVNQEGIVLVTRDHSLVEDMVERGELTREQARTHPHKNLITRALGAEPVLLADCFRQSMAPGDYLLLCSDGLSNVVTEQEMLYEVIHGGEDESCCQRLLDIALHRGAPDNVTAVLIRR